MPTALDNDTNCGKRSVSGIAFAGRFKSEPLGGPIGLCAVPPEPDAQIMNMQSDRRKSRAPTMPNEMGLRWRVLVVDDDTDSAGALVDILEHSGYEATAVNDGKQALTHLKAEQLPDVMILDLFMPRMNGWDLMRELKRNAKLANIPVIVVSAFAYAPGIEADAVLSKPVDMEALQNKMSELVTRGSQGN